MLGSRASLQLLASITLAAGLVLARAAARRQRIAAAGAALTGIVLFAWLVARVPHPFDLGLKRLSRGEELLWREEGIQTTVAVHWRRRQQIMYLDGHHQANDSPGTAFVHQRIGWLPTVLHREPRRALVVGLGGAPRRVPSRDFPASTSTSSSCRRASWVAQPGSGRSTSTCSTGPMSGSGSTMGATSC
jgi:hypothetical protein